MSELLFAQLPALTLATPLFAAPLAFVANARGARAIAVFAAALEVVFAALLVWRVASVGPLVYRIGGWGAPLGIDFSVDGISAVMIVLTAAVGLAVTAYAAAYFGPDERYRHYWPLWLFLWASLVALFSTNDAFNLYVCLELVSVSAVALVSVGGSKPALVAAMRYMLAAVAGSLFYLLGVALLYGGVGALDLGVIAVSGIASDSAQAGLALIVAGLVVKTALVPMHFWLPPAHANAPSPVSAVLSALVVKGSFYIILRLSATLDAADLAAGLPVVLGVLGSIAILWGSVQAVLQERLKMLVAYSTVAQIGYLFILFPLVAVAGVEDSAVALTAGVFHAVSHGLAKGGMFLAAGAVLSRVGHDRIEGLAGLARTYPAASAAFAIAGVSMVGLPPSGGFVSKWLYVTAALNSGAWWWAVVVLVGGLLAAVYVFRVVAIFMRVPDPDAQPLAPAVPMLGLVPLALALASLFVGVLGQPILRLLALPAMVLTGVAQ